MGSAARGSMAGRIPFANRLGERLCRGAQYRAPEHERLPEQRRVELEERLRAHAEEVLRVAHEV